MGRNPGGVSGRMTRPAGGILRLPRPAAMQLCLPRMGQSVDSTRPRWHARLQSEEMKSSKAKAFDLCVLRSEEHTSELQSLMRLSYAVFFLNKKISYFVCI